MPVNFVVNNDGHYFPRVTASFTADGTSLSKLNDGNYWYLQNPPNRWTCVGSPNKQDWIEINLGEKRLVESVKLFVLDDRDQANSAIRSPESLKIERWNGSSWIGMEPVQVKEAPEGHRPHEWKFDKIELQKLRITLVHAEGYRSGLTEVEIWGEAILPLSTVPPPPGNLAFNDGSKPFPSATASYQIALVAILNLRSMVSPISYPRR